MTIPTIAGRQMTFAREESFKDMVSSIIRAGMKGKSLTDFLWCTSVANAVINFTECVHI